MINQTIEFRDICKEITKLKYINQANTNESIKPRKFGNELLDFFANANQLVADLSQLRDYLAASRHDLVSTSSLAMSSMVYNDDQCDEIDAKCEHALSRSRILLDTLKTMHQHHNESSKHCFIGKQALDHERIVLQVIQTYTSSINAIHLKYKNIRKNKLANLRKLTRLSDLLKNASQPFPQYSRENQSVEDIKEARNKIYYEPDNEKHSESEQTDEGKLRRRRPIDQNETATEENSNTADSQLQQENVQLYQRFNKMTFDFENLSTRVTEIGELQSVFNEHIDRQATMVDNIYMTSVHVSEDINYGNEQIRQAMKRKADIRVWVLFCIVVLTFTLWFLHWYNP